MNQKKQCPFCKTEYTSPFCPNGCNIPDAPYITQRQQDKQGCPFCGSNRIQVVRETVLKRRWFHKGTKKIYKLRRICADCGRSFK